MADNSVGILGGTFNPVHRKHIELAEAACSQLCLSKVLIIPSGISYFKDGTGVLPGEVRYEMCKLAFGDDPRFVVSDMEIKRPGNSYTCDTLRELISSAPGNTYYYIVGEDTFFSLETWKSPEIIFKSCVIVVADRDRADRERITRQIRIYEGRYNAAVRTLDIVPDTTSSSEIREMIRRGEDTGDYLPPQVAEYIRKNKLYL